jgi:hypothetical protein
MGRSFLSRPSIINPGRGLSLMKKHEAGMKGMNGDENKKVISFIPVHPFHPGHLFFLVRFAAIAAH